MIMVFWGFNVAATKTLVMNIDPLMLTAFRIGTAGITVLIISKVMGIFRFPHVKEWSTIGFITIFNVVAHHLFLSTRLTLTTGVNTGLILGSSPLVVMMLSIILLKDRITRLRIAGFILSFVGIVLTTLAGPEGISSFSLVDLYIFISLLTQAYIFFFISIF